MPRDLITNHYEVSLTISFTGRNQYGDALPSGSIDYTGKTSAKNMAELGAILQAIQAVLNEHA